MRTVIAPERLAYETYVRYCQSLRIRPSDFDAWRTNSKKADGSMILDLRISKRGVIK